MSLLASVVLEQITRHWNEHHWIGHGCLPPEQRGGDSLLRLAGEAGMHWPYLTLVQASSQPAVREFTTPMAGHRQRLIDPGRVERLVRDGYTMKFQRVEDFDDVVRSEVAGLQARFGLVTTAYGFVTPAESRGLSFHRDASHVVAVQLDGRKSWEVIRPSGGSRPDAGLQPDPEGERITFELAPGDVLYLPHGWPHRARTTSARSTHLTFTLARPEPSALAAELLTGGRAHPKSVLEDAVHRLGL